MKSPMRLRPLQILNSFNASLLALIEFLLLCIALTGRSLSPLAKHTAAFSQASNLVITNSKDAYRAVNHLRQREQIEAAVYAYDKDPHWNPYTNIRPLLTSSQLDARIEVLDGLKMYADTLVQLIGAPIQDECSESNSEAE